MIYLGNVPVGIADKGIGKLSMYQTLKATPSTTGALSFSHSLGTVPKVVLITSTATGTNKIKTAIASLDAGVGAYKYTDGTSGTGGFFYLVEDETPTAYQQAHLGQQSCYLRAVSSTRTFDTGVEYTVELYA